MNNLRNRRTLLAAGVTAVVLSMLAVGLGSANAGMLSGMMGGGMMGGMGGGGGLMGGGMNNSVQSAMNDAARSLLSASNEAMDAGQTVSRACRNTGTDAGDLATATGEQAQADGMDGAQAARRLLTQRGNGSGRTMMANAEAAFTAAQTAMQSARAAVAAAQDAAASNPAPRRGTQRMLNNAVRGLNSGAQDMEAARDAITTARVALSRR